MMPTAGRSERLLLEGVPGAWCADVVHAWSMGWWHEERNWENSTTRPSGWVLGARLVEVLAGNELLEASLVEEGLIEDTGDALGRGFGCGIGILRGSGR